MTCIEFMDMTFVFILHLYLMFKIISEGNNSGSKDQEYFDNPCSDQTSDSLVSMH
mgnify:CR=1 FL=1